MGRHRTQEDTDEMNRVTLVEATLPQHKMPTGRLSSISFVIAFIGLILGWILFGIPSAVATAFAWKAYKDPRSEDKLLSKVALGMGVAGMILGAVTSFVVTT